MKFFRGRTERVCASLASVVRDPHNPEDVLKGGDDHPADGLRYGVNHVYRARKRKPKEPEGMFTGKKVLQMLEELDVPDGRYG